MPTKENVKEYCVGCDSNFYNGNNPLGIKECWNFRGSRIVTRYRIGVQTPQDKKENFTEVETLNCHAETNGYAYYDKLPEHLNKLQE